MGAGCLILNAKKEILLVKPTYKSDWEIPGGIVEENESPKSCCEREVLEELSIPLKINELLVVDYNSPQKEKTESLMFIFNGGKISEEQIDLIKLPPKEIEYFSFFKINSLPADIVNILRKRIVCAYNQLEIGPIYTEDQI